MAVFLFNCKHNLAFHPLQNELKSYLLYIIMKVVKSSYSSEPLWVECISPLIKCVRSCFTLGKATFLINTLTMEKSTMLKITRRKQFPINIIVTSYSKP